MKATKTFSEYLDYCRKHDVNISKWNVMTLHEKIISGKILTESEYLAKLFLEETGKYMKGMDN